MPALCAGKGAKTFILCCMSKRGGNLVIFAGQTLHDPQRARTAVRNAERVEERLGLFFPTLIQHLNELAGKWHLEAPHVQIAASQSR